MKTTITAIVCVTTLIATSAWAAPPTSVEGARDAFNQALEKKDRAAFAELVGGGTLTLKRYGDKTRYKKADILKSKILEEDLMDSIPKEAKCRKTTCKWREKEYCSHADGVFQVKFKKKGGTFYLTSYTFDCK